MALKQAPVYNASNESEMRILNTDHFEQVKPHADVAVDPGAVNTPCVEVVFHSGTSVIVLVDYSSMYSQLEAITGTIDNLGNIL